MLRSLEGIYRNGIVELPEIPIGMGDETPVIVTFLESDGISLRPRGIIEEQAAYLRGSLRTFAADWEDEEMDVYDDYDANKFKI